jgi:hypothetical protein
VTYYRKPDGTSPSEVNHYRDVLKPLRRLFGHTAVSVFGPLNLKALRDEMVRLGWCRTNINRHVAPVRHLFKWGVENELVPPNVFHSLAAVSGLRIGRTKARESEPVKPVAESTVQAVLPYLSRQVGAMVRLQMLTDMRPGRWLRKQYGAEGRPRRARSPIRRRRRPPLSLKRGKRRHFVRGRLPVGRFLLWGGFCSEIQWRDVIDLGRVDVAQVGLGDNPFLCLRRKPCVLQPLANVRLGVSDAVCFGKTSPNLP